jgi:hypothetical protein
MAKTHCLFLNGEQFDLGLEKITNGSIEVGMGERKSTAMKIMNKEY